MTSTPPYEHPPWAPRTRGSQEGARGWFFRAASGNAFRMHFSRFKAEEEERRRESKPNLGLRHGRHEAYPILTKEYEKIV